MPTHPPGNTGGEPRESVVADGQADPAYLGAVIRQARRGRFSVEELAQRAGVSSGLISKIERGLGNPSFATLTHLAYALDLSIGSFFDAPVSAGRMVVRRNERRRLVMPHASLVYELLTPSLQGKLGMVRTRIAPSFDNHEQPFQHVGEESVHVLSGRLEVFVGHEHFYLEEGDTVTYDSGLPHWWRNAQNVAAEVIGAMTPPSF